MIYLDHAAHSPLLDVARDAWVNSATRAGNPSAIHGAGRAARAILEDSREAVAEVLGVDSAEIMWTSGGTESDNLAVQGPAFVSADDADHRIIAVSAIEHPAVREAAELARSRGGVQAVTIPVDRSGIVDPAAVVASLRGAGATADSDITVSVMAVNNETGLIQPLPQIVAAVRAEFPNARIHTDAVQAVGRIDIAANEQDESAVDALSISAHKLGGGVGTGVLMARRTYPLAMLEGGGGQERAIRSGTINTAGAAALAAALTWAHEHRAERAERLGQLRDLLVGEALASIEGAFISGDPDGPRVPHIAHIIVPGVDAEALILGLDMAGISAATGSACSAGVRRPSPVLLAMGYDEIDASGGLRLSLGDSTTRDDIEATLAALPQCVAMARSAAARRSARNKVTGHAETHMDAQPRGPVQL